MVTAARLDGDGLLTICTTRSICGIFDNATATAIDSNVAEALEVNRARAGPVGSGEDCAGHEFNGDRCRHSATAMGDQQLLTGPALEPPTEKYGGAGADLMTSIAPTRRVVEPTDGKRITATRAS